MYGNSLVLPLTDPVRDVTFEPADVTTLRAGEPLRCTARGNPAPSIVTSVEVMTSPGAEKGPEGAAAGGGAGASGEGGVVVMQEAWVGREVRVGCRASNELNGREHSLARNVTISVKGIVWVTELYFLNCDRFTCRTCNILNKMVLLRL